MNNIICNLISEKFDLIMIESSQRQKQIIECFPLLKSTTPEFQKNFFNATTAVHPQQGQPIAMEGDECAQLALVLNGKVRVYKMAATGREITLYHIDSGDSCVLTASCIMSDTPFPAIAEAQTDLDAIIIPAHQARQWMTESQPWCTFVFGLVSKRLAEVIAVLEDVAFQRMDTRIANYLSNLASNNTTLKITHHEIAANLGSSREVVSRILKDFETRGVSAGC